MFENTRHLHNVFFTLKDSSPDAASHLMDDCHTYLAPHNGVLFFAAGVRTTDCTREVNDQDYDVGLTILFESRAAHDSYQTTVMHNTFIERNAGNFERVRVFDSSDSPANPVSDPVPKME